VCSDDEMDDLVGVRIELPASSSHYLLHPTSPLRSAAPTEEFNVAGFEGKRKKDDEGPSHKLMHVRSSSGVAKYVELSYTRLRIVVPKK